MIVGTPAADRSRPEVWVNCAASIDGRIAYANGSRARLSSPEDLVRVHRLRAQVDGIVVGVGTVVKDDPSLAVKWDLVGTPAGRAPARIVVDGSGRIPPAARVLDGSIPTIVATSSRAQRSYPSHVRTVRVGDRRQVDLPILFARLQGLGMRRLLVEGGAQILATVLREGLFDRWTVYYAPVLIGGATAPPMVAGPETPGEGALVRLELAGMERMGAGYVATYLPGLTVGPRERSPGEHPPGG